MPTIYFHKVCLECENSRVASMHVYWDAPRPSGQASWHHLKKIVTYRGMHQQILYESLQQLIAIFYHIFTLYLPYFTIYLPLFTPRLVVKSLLVISVFFLNRNQRCERPIFTRSHLRSFLHTSHVKDFMKVLHLIFLFREPFASYASMEVLVSNCELKTWVLRRFRKKTPKAFNPLVPASLPHSRQPKKTKKNKKIWGKCLASYSLLIFVFLFSWCFLETYQKTSKNQKNRKNKKNKKKQRFEGNVCLHIVS